MEELKKGDQDMELPSSDIPPPLNHHPNLRTSPPSYDSFHYMHHEYLFFSSTPNPPHLQKPNPLAPFPSVGQFFFPPVQRERINYYFQNSIAPPVYQPPDTLQPLTTQDDLSSDVGSISSMVPSQNGLQIHPNTNPPQMSPEEQPQSHPNTSPPQTLPEEQPQPQPNTNTPQTLQEEQPQWESLVSRVSIAQEAQHECTICQQWLEVGELVIQLPCNHLYHRDCITPWMDRSGTCPNCRLQIVTPTNNEHDEDDYESDTTSVTDSDGELEESLVEELRAAEEDSDSSS